MNSQPSWESESVGLPPERKPWMSGDARMAIFDAVAFALALFGSERGVQ